MKTCGPGVKQKEKKNMTEKDRGASSLHMENEVAQCTLAASGVITGLGSLCFVNT